MESDCKMDEESESQPESDEAQPFQFEESLDYDCFDELDAYGQVIKDTYTIEKPKPVIIPPPSNAGVSEPSKIIQKAGKSEQK